MTRKYGDLDNPTGIYVNEGDEVVVLVGDTHGQSISIQNIELHFITTDIFVFPAMNLKLYFGGFYRSFE